MDIFFWKLVAPGGSCSSLCCRGLSLFSSGCLAEQHPGAQAHGGSIGQPLEQGIEEEPGLGGAAGNLFTFSLCSEVREVKFKG